MLWHRHPDVRAFLTLADNKNCCLYEIKPDLAPYVFLTDFELTLWSLYYKEREKMNG